MKHETLTAWLQWLEQQHPKAIDMGLDRVAEVAARLSLTPVFHGHSTVITVAGTNGKGSFIATLQALLLAQGKTVATYTSPHLLSFNERMMINGELASDQQIMLAFDQVYSALQQTSLSYFEFTTVAAMVMFQQQDADYCLFEVGLGGRLDAVNILPPDWAVITSIGLDHCDYLGDTLESIAYEKCGILRQGTPLICAEANAPAPLRQACDQHVSTVIDKQFCVEINHLPGEPLMWQYKNLENGAVSMPLPDNGLSLSSQSAAIALAEQLLPQGLDLMALNSLSTLYLPGRFQRFVQDGVDIVMDVAHNVQAVTLLQSRLQQQLPLAEGGKRIAVFAMLQDKDISEIIALLKDDFSAWFVGELKHDRAISASDLAAKIHAQGINMISVSKNMRQAFARARSLCVPGDQILVIGSFFTVAEILPKMHGLERS